MSAANDTPIESGGSSEVCFTKESGNLDSQFVWQTKQILWWRASGSMISWKCTDLTTEPSNCVMNEQIWQRGSVHSDALRHAKSYGIFTEPLRCLTLIWYLLTVDRNDVTWGFAENSPLQSFSTACIQGLLSVNTRVMCRLDNVRAEMFDSSSYA